MNEKASRECILHQRSMNERFQYILLPLFLLVMDVAYAIPLSGDIKMPPNVWCVHTVRVQVILFSLSLPSLFLSFPSGFRGELFYLFLFLFKSIWLWSLIFPTRISPRHSKCSLYPMTTLTTNLTWLLIPRVLGLMHHHVYILVH